MPSQSKTQQRLMGVAYAVKSGSMQLSDVDTDYRDRVKDLVDGMTLKQLKDFAETKHEGLPEVKENITPANIGGMGPVMLPTSSTNGSGDVPAGQGDAKQEYKKKRKKMKHVKTFESFINESLLKESHFTAGDSVECIDSGMIGSVIGSTGEGDEEIYIVSINGETKEYSPEELRLVESVVTEASKIKMNALDWGKTTAERNANQDKYDSLKTDKERQEFLKKLKNKSVDEAVINEMDSEAALLLADEVSGEVYTARLKGKSATITATTTTKTWADGVPVLKNLARGRSKSIKFELYQRPFKVIHDVAHDWFYFTDGGKWYGLHSSDGYYEPSDLPFEMTLD
jgi:hypothetical protein